MKVVRLALAISVLSACGASSPTTTTAPSPGAHAIHLNRTLAVGTTWGELTHYASQQHETIRVGDAIVRDTSNASTIELGAECTVLALDANGRASQLRVAIDHATLDVGTGARSMPVPNVVVITRGEPGTIVGENGEAIADETAEQLRHVLPDRATPSDDDAVLGTREPQDVGARWSLDSQGTARGLATMQLAVDPSNVHGSTTLVSAGDESGVDVLTLRTEILASHVGFAGLPPGAVEERADMHAIIDVVMPTDTAIVPLRDATRADIDIEVLVPTETGGRATVDVTIHEHTEHVRTPR